jgi:translation initiation factor IF-1
MSGENPFEVEGVIVEILPNGTYRVELKNGHRLLGYVTGKARVSLSGLACGTKIRLRLSPFDLSEGRLLELAEPRAKAGGS